MGGAVFVEAGLLGGHSLRTEFTSCSAGTSGGALFADSFAASEVTESMFYNNSAGFSGGAIAAAGGGMAIRNCTFAECKVSVTVTTATCLTLTMKDVSACGARCICPSLPPSSRLPLSHFLRA